MCLSVCLSVYPSISNIISLCDSKSLTNCGFLYKERNCIRFCRRRRRYSARVSHNYESLKLYRLLENDFAPITMLALNDETLKASLTLGIEALE